MPRRIVGLVTPQSKQAPFAEFKDGEWRIWLTWARGVTAGTYLVLHATGAVDRITENAAGEIVDATLIYDKPEDE